MVHKGDNHVPEKQKPLASVRVGHITELVRGNIELLRQDLPIAACLIEHIHKIRVLENVFNLARREQILNVLRDSGRIKLFM